MSLKTQTKPHPGLLTHFSQDSVLTMELPSQANDQAAASHVKPCSGSALAWPHHSNAVEAQCRSAETAPSLLSHECESRISVGLSQMQKTKIGSRQGAPMPLEDSSKVSISKLSRVIDGLEEKEGFVSKADVIAAIRANRNLVHANANANSIGEISRLQNNHQAGGIRSRPSSALEKVERYQFQTRPASAGGSRPRRSASAAANPERLDARRIITIENALVDGGKDMMRQSATNMPSHVVPRDPSRERPLKRRLQRQRSVPTPSLLNFSRQYPGLRSTVCW